MRSAGIPLHICADRIDSNSRLTPNSLIVSGWSHLFGNLMKFYLKRHDEWPAKLAQIRDVCKFMRNHTNRDEMIRYLKPRVPGVQKSLKSFKGQIAKWRYETAAVVFKAMGNLKELIEEHLQDLVAIFGTDVQDRALLPYNAEAKMKS